MFISKCSFQNEWNELPPLPLTDVDNARACAVYTIPSRFSEPDTVYLMAYGLGSSLFTPTNAAYDLHKICFQLREPEAEL